MEFFPATTMLGTLMLSDEDKATIDSLSDSELRFEIERGRASRFQGERYAYLKVRLAELEKTKDVNSENRELSFWKRPWTDAEKWLMGILATVISTSIFAIVSYSWMSLRTLRSVDFSTSPSEFGLAVSVTGTAAVKPSEIVVRIENASFTLNHQLARKASSIRVVLAKVRAESWEVIGTSERTELDLELSTVGETVSVENLVMSIPITKADAIAGHYLVFDIDDCTLGTVECGTSHAHTRTDLF